VRKRVVVLGGGFAGLAAAKRLGKSQLDVIVIDQHNFHTFQPLLYQVATAGLEPADAAYPIRSVFRQSHNVSFRHGKVSEILPSDHAVRLKDGTEIAYDFLIVATGAAASFHGIPGASSNTRALYTLADARRLRNHLLSTLENVDSHPDNWNGGAPVFVVIGGGPTGVEIAGAIVELLDVSVRHDRLSIDRERTRVIVVDALGRLLNGFDERASRYAESTLASRGIEVRLRTAVAEVKEDAVALSDGEIISPAVVVWAGGMTVAGTLAAQLPGEAGPGQRVVVAPDLSLPGHPEIFVVGDASAVPRGVAPMAASRARRAVNGDVPSSEQLCPQLAQVAIQSGEHAASQVLNRVAECPTQPFSYHDKGMMATIGRRAAITQLPNGVVIRGTMGWFGWLGLHLIYLIGFRNRLKVLINWWWRYLDWPSGPRLIVADVEASQDGTAEAPWDR